MTEEEVSELSYEQALNKLEKVVETLESGSAPLDQSIELYTLGSVLKDHCQKKLDAAEEKISIVIKKNNEKSLAIEPLSTS